MVGSNDDNVDSASVTEPREYVDNGILFFVFNKVNFMSHDDILAICNDFYTEDDVAQAKSLMFEKYKCPEKEKMHRGTTKKANDLKDIISFLSRNVATGIVFCITKCTQVPSVSMDFIDAPSMSQHMSTLRMEMSIMSARYHRLSAKMNEIESTLQQKQDLSTSKTEDTVMLDTTNGVESLVSKARNKAHNPTMADVVRSRNFIDKNQQWKSVHRANDRTVQAKNKLMRQGLNTAQTVTDCTTDEDENDDGDDWNVPRQVYQRLKRSQNKHLTRLNEDRKNEDYGRRRRRKPPIIGKGDGSTLRAAQALRTVSLFVSRLEPSIGSEVLLSHISNIAGVTTVECDQLEQKYSHYLSFKVTVKGMLKDKVNDLYNPENWDRDILVRRWYDA